MKTFVGKHLRQDLGVYINKFCVPFVSMGNWAESYAAVSGSSPLMATNTTISRECAHNRNGIENAAGAHVLQKYP